MSEAPLAGLRVLDLTRVLAGPYCTMVLGDLGADVVKVETSHGGDETRTWGPPFVGGESAYFLAVNRGKRSVALDLRDARARAAVTVLATNADIVLENFKAGGAAKLGVAYEDVRAVNPSVVYCSITAFGSERSPADRPGYDFVVQAETGLMSITGVPDGEPMRVGVALIDVLAALHAATAILAALHRRENSGVGERIEVSLLDTGLASLINVAQSALVTGGEPGRHGNAHPSIAPYETFRAADGWIALGAANDGHFARLCEAVGRPELTADERFATNAARVANRAALANTLSTTFGSRPAGEWVDILERARVPVGSIRTVLDAFASAAAAGDAATMTVRHPTAGAVDLVRPVARLAGAEATDVRPPPLLGEHTRDVLREAGLTEAEIEALLRDGVAVDASPRLPPE